MKEIISTLRKHPKATLEVGMSLLSSAFEVDDALQEPWHPRDLIIRANTTALKTSLRLKYSGGINEDAVETGNAPRPPNEDQENPALSPEQSDRRSQLQVLHHLPLRSTAVERLAKLTTPLWVIAVLLGLNLFK